MMTPFKIGEILLNDFVQENLHLWNKINWFQRHWELLSGFNDTENYCLELTIHQKNEPKINEQTNKNDNK